MTRVPLVSICIPTCDRAAWLEATLSSLTRQPAFQNTGEVEIVVSDNRSADGTPAVVESFQARYPGRITSRRQAEPISASANFAAVLEAGRGRLRKLHNDTLRADEGFLDECLRLAREHQAERPLLFFANGRGFSPRAARLTACPGLESFLARVSFYSTWIGGFSLWAEDVPVYAPLFRTAGHHFAQTEILFEALAGGREALVYNPEFARVAYDAPKDHLTREHLRTVYFAEYAPLLRARAARGDISAAAERRELTRFCLFFYVPYYHRLAGRRFSPAFRAEARFLREYVPGPACRGLYAFYLLFCLFDRLFSRRDPRGSLGLGPLGRLIRSVF